LRELLAVVEIPDVEDAAAVDPGQKPVSRPKCRRDQVLLRLNPARLARPRGVMWVAFLLAGRAAVDPDHGGAALVGEDSQAAARRDRGEFECPARPMRSGFGQLLRYRQIPGADSFEPARGEYLTGRSEDDV